MFESKLGPAETRMWMGIRFYRYPEAPRNSDRKYFKAGRLYLHVLVWIFENRRAVPEGHHIHHRDEDPGNNEPDNLEARDAFAHMAYHNRAGTGKNTREAKIERLQANRQKAADWHASPEGRAWHSQNGRRQIHPLRDKTCSQCGCSFQDKNHKKGNCFCSGNCRNKWRYANHLDDVARLCELCGGSFTTHKYNKTRFCSRVCAGASRRGDCYLGAASSVRPDGERAA